MSSAPPVTIIGHRNPDADAICSAIAYAALKNHDGGNRYQAARCGNSNSRIDAILKRFGVALPTFVGDVTPRVRDIMTSNVIKVGPEATATEALELFDTHDLRVIPVTDADNRLLGAISIFDLGDYFIPKRKSQPKMRHVHASLSDIVQSLRAEAVHLVEPDRIDDLFVRVAAMDINSFGKIYQNDPHLVASSVIVVGDRTDIQEVSIHAGVRMIVITNGLPVQPHIVELARQRGVSLIRNSEDSATTTWLIRSAARVERLVRKPSLTFSPDEKLSLVRRRMINAEAYAYMVIDDDNRLLGMFTKTDLIKPVKTSIILVDHNELSQAVTGADQVNILEIVDHHRLGNPPTQQPILFINAPLGSTCTLVADLFEQTGIKPSAAIAGVMMGGIISDTLNLKGPTATPHDADVLQRLSGIAGISADELAHLIFNSGSVILSRTPDAVVSSDLKTYEEAGLRFAVSQVEELGFDSFWSRQEALSEALQQLVQAEGLHFASLLVTDINTQNSLLVVRGHEDFVARITYPAKSRTDVFELNGVVSRKKQLLPYLTSLLHGVAG